MDKYQLSKLARENRLSAPETLLASEISPNDIELVLGFPALIKLRSSTGQRGHKLVQNVVEYERHLQTLLHKNNDDEIIVQEYIPGTVLESMYTVGLIFDTNHNLQLSVPLKR